MSKDYQCHLCSKWVIICTDHYISVHWRHFQSTIALKSWSCVYARWVYCETAPARPTATTITNIGRCRSSPTCTCSHKQHRFCLCVVHGSQVHRSDVMAREIVTPRVSIGSHSMRTQIFISRLRYQPAPTSCAQALPESLVLGLPVEQVRNPWNLLHGRIALCLATSSLIQSALHPSSCISSNK